jgi:hypothetical protein
MESISQAWLEPSKFSKTLLLKRYNTAFKTDFALCFLQLIPFSGGTFYSQKAGRVAEFEDFGQEQ